MKALVYWLFAILSTVIFTGCMSSEELAMKKSLRCKSVKEIKKDGHTEVVIKFRRYKHKDYISKKIEVYEIKEWLYPILDSIIIKTEECPIYQDLSLKIAFHCAIWSDPVTHLGITVDYIPKYTNHAEMTNGIFYYKGYDFYYGGDFQDAFLKKTNKTISITCIDPKKYQYELHDRGDANMEWYYDYINEQMINRSYGYCSEEPTSFIINKKKSQLKVTP